MFEGSNRGPAWRAIAAVGLVAALGALAVAAQGPAPATPAGQAPAAPGQVTPQGRGGAPGAPPAAPAAPTAAVLARTFTAPVGLVFNTVRPERVAEFERLLAEVQTALKNSKNPTTQAQAKGWRFYKATEAGPNGAAMFVFVIDPVVASEDYSLGKVLVEAFPDPVKLQEVWALYTGSVTGGGSLLNLTPVSAVVPPTPLPGAAPPAPAATPKPLPPDADPTRNP
jgi:hypothetical protein